MRLKGFLALAILSVSILSFGFNGMVYATEHNIPPISAKTELPSYENGDRVYVTGSIKNYDASSGHGLTYKVLSPDNNIVGIGQIAPDSNGNFALNFVAGGALWKLNGNYVIEFHLGHTEGQVTLVYTGGEYEQPPPPQEEPVTCGANQVLVNGKCVAKEPTITCGANQVLVNGKCVDKEPEPEPEPEPTKCGPGTELVNGVCKPIKAEPKGGGCLIATAAYGTELAPQVQFLREVRDGTVMSTASGAAFMTGFNQLYYSFSPTIADWERQNPIFQESVRIFITPMLSTLSIMTLAENGSEVEVLGFGISVIALNLAMYIAAPAFVGYRVHKHFKTRK